MIIKDLNLKAIHNGALVLDCFFKLSMIIKDLNLKAIHNHEDARERAHEVVNDHQRSESESNSQRQG